MIALTKEQARQAVERWLMTGGPRGTRDHRHYEIAKRRLRRRLDKLPSWPLSYDETVRIVADYVGV